MELDAIKREELIETELKLYSEINSKATFPLMIKGETQYLPVVKIDPQLLLLNPQNHRVNAQLCDGNKKEAVMANPHSIESQKTISDLLRATEQYTALKDQLVAFGQREPGVVTREGLLVDGNTRVAALIDLGKTYVDVAVLPKNVGESDVADIELTLQMENLVKQDYTFTNLLLHMHDYVQKGGSKKELAKRKGWSRGGEKKVDVQLRLFHYIEEVRRLTSPPVPYHEFDKKEQHLKDLDQDYQGLINSSEVEAAEALKWNRLSAMFLGLNKDQVRIIDEDFFDDKVKRRLDDDSGDETNVKSLELLNRYLPREINSGYEEIFGEVEEDDQFIDMKGFLRDYLKKADDENVEELYGGIRWASRRVSERLIDEQKLGKQKAKPTELIQDAKERVGTVRTELNDVINESGFKLGDLRFAVNKLMKEVEKLAREIEGK